MSPVSTSTTAPKQRQSHFDAESEFRGVYSKDVFRALYWAYRSYRTRLFFSLTLGFLSRTILMSNALVLGWWADSLLGKELPLLMAQWGHAQFLLALVVLTGLGFTLTLLWRSLFARASARAVSTIHDEAVARVSRFPMTFFEKNPVGRVVTRFSSDYGNIFRMFGGPLSEFLTLCFDILASVILATLILPWFAVIVILLFGGFWLLYRHHKFRLRSARRDQSRLRSPSVAHFSESYQGASLLRVFDRVEHFESEFRDLEQRYQSARLHNGWVNLVYSLHLYLVTGLAFVLIGVSANELITRGWLSPGTLGVALTYVFLISQNLQSFFDWLGQFEDALTGVERLNEYLTHDLESGARLPSGVRFPTRQPRDLAPDNSEMSTGDVGQTQSAAISIRDLIFSYGEASKVFQRFHYDIRAGEKIGIVGRTGSGKSTLAQLMVYLYPFESGEIRVNGKKPWLDLTRPQLEDEIDLKQYREAFSWITQDPILFRGTLIENLCIDESERERVRAQILGLTFDEQGTQKNVDTGVVKMGLDRILKYFPGGLETPIEERGRNLSAGERQLICLMRAALKPTPIIIMDEATSAIDPRLEALVMESCEQLFRGRTQIIIAHRLGTLARCDRVLDLSCASAVPS